MVHHARVALMALAIAAAAALAHGSAPLTTPALAQAGEPADLQVQVRVAIEAYFAAVMSGEADKVAAVIAPEFQVLRADGSRYDAKSYPESSLPIIAAMPTIEKLTVTATGDIAVASYEVNVNQTRDGAVVEANAPRLTVLRREGDSWLIVAHGNFAALEE